MENPLVIHQEGVKAAYTRDHGTEFIRLISPLKIEKKNGQYGDRTRDIRVISTTL